MKRPTLHPNSRKETSLGITSCMQSWVWMEGYWAVAHLANLDVAQSTTTIARNTPTVNATRSTIRMRLKVRGYRLVLCSYEHAICVVPSTSNKLE